LVEPGELPVGEQRREVCGRVADIDTVFEGELEKPDARFEDAESVTSLSVRHRSHPSPSRSTTPECPLLRLWLQPSR
jgi:hypothetical protein